MVAILIKLFLSSNRKLFLFSGYARRNSLEPEIRRRTASLSTPHRASDIQVDPDQAALLFRDARGVSFHIDIYFKHFPGWEGVTQMSTISLIV